MRRFAAYDPECVACLAGPLGDRTLAEGTDLLVGALQRLGAVAREAGTWVGFEPVHRSQREEAGFVNSLADADGVLAVAGAPQVGILFDTYHLWDDPEVLPWIEANISRIVGVHVSDWPAARPHRPRPSRPRASPTRSSSSPRSSSQAGTAPSTSRSSRRRSSSGASRSTRPPAAPTPRPLRSTERRG